MNLVNDIRPDVPDRIHIPPCCAASHWATTEPTDLDLVQCADCGGLKTILACRECSCDCGDDFISVAEVIDIMARATEPDILVLFLEDEGATC